MTKKNDIKGIQSRSLRGKPTSMPKHWWAGDPVMTHFYNALSLLLPVGEEAFIKSVTHYEADIVDPKLKRDVRAFVVQEAQHNKEHGVWYNGMLAEQGYDVEAIAKNFTQAMRYFSRTLPPMVSLAQTVAAEHLTAILSCLILSKPGWLAGVPSEYRLIWEWHATEEIEHKAVAFDLFHAMGGSYGLRCVAGLQLLVVFPLVMAEMMVRFLHQDKLLGKPKTWWQILKLGGMFLRHSGMMAKRYVAFLLPGFHPNNHDDEEVLALYQVKLARSTG